MINRNLRPVFGDDDAVQLPDKSANEVAEKVGLMQPRRRLSRLNAIDEQPENHTEVNNASIFDESKTISSEYFNQLLFDI